MTARLVAARDEHVAAVLYALDLALEDAELNRVTLVVGGVESLYRQPPDLSRAA